MSRTRVVVTGGAGFIGSHLCEALLASGHQVTCIDNLVGTRGSTRNLSTVLDDPCFELVVADVVDWAASAELTGVDCIFHLAASKNSVALDDPERDLRVNTTGTLRLLLQSAGHGVRKFVHSSTGSVFGETMRPHREDGAKRPVSIYGVSKLAGESYCRVIGDSFGLDYTILRYYHVIGPRQDGSDRGGVVPIFVRRCLEARPVIVYGTGQQTRSFTAVEDIVAANLLAASSPQAVGEDFICASGISVSIQELADFVITEVGNPSGVRYEPPRLGDIVHFRVDNSKIRRLGITFATEWQALVRNVIAHMREDPRGSSPAGFVLS